MIVLQQTAKPLTAHDAPGVSFLGHNGDDQPVAQALMITFEVIMLNELANRSTERSFTDENQPVQA